MFKYFLTRKAINDLSKIWDYTFEFWSENQADKYYFELLYNCQLLAEKQISGRNYVEIDKEILGFISCQHIIFYRFINDKEIEIVRFLHSRMDLESRIKEY